MAAQEYQEGRAGKGASLAAVGAAAVRTPQVWVAVVEKSYLGIVSHCFAAHAAGVMTTVQCYNALCKLPQHNRLLAVQGLACMPARSFMRIMSPPSPSHADMSAAVLDTCGPQNKSN